MKLSLDKVYIETEFRMLIVFKKNYKVSLTHATIGFTISIYENTFVLIIYYGNAYYTRQCVL